MWRKTVRRMDPSVSMLRSAAASIAIVGLVFTPRLAFSAIVPICIEAGEQSAPVSVSDGAGGALIAWADHRSGTDNDIYVQHVLASGAVDASWPVGGVNACSAALLDQSSPVITSDGSGGAIVAWLDYGYDRVQIRAQHVLANGTRDGLWYGYGNLLSDALSQKYTPCIAGDGAHGAIVGWADLRQTNGTDIYAQRVLANGTLAGGGWPANGQGLGTSPFDESSPVIISDGAGGAILAWQGYQGGVTAGYDIYAMRVLEDGTRMATWLGSGRGLDLSSAIAGNQLSPAITSDGSGGAIFMWQDRRNGDYDIYGQRRHGDGSIGESMWWLQDFASAGGDQVSPALTTDGAGGVILAWQDARTGTNDIYALHILTGGIVDGGAWGIGGRDICTAAGNQTAPRIVPDGLGGAIIAWNDDRGADTDVYAQRVLFNGDIAPGWLTNGSPIVTASNTQWFPTLTQDGNGGAIIAWQDRASGSGDVYANVADFAVGVAPPRLPLTVQFAAPRPNPARESVTFKLALPAESYGSLILFDARGRRVRSLLDGALSAGETARTWDLRDDAGRDVGPGIYFATFSGGGSSATRRFAVVR
jgi:hypothetical protein